MQQTVPAVFMRGGTSKGLFFHKADLPSSDKERDAVVLSAMGSPDGFGRQLDGMGGGLSSLSKVMIIEASRRQGVDVEYRFGQVSVRSPIVHYDGNCGNLTAAVAAFAVDEGLVQHQEGTQNLMLMNKSTGKRVEATLSVIGGGSQVEGDFMIDGVPSAGSRIRLNFLEPGGALTGLLLPTGLKQDSIVVPGLGQIQATIIDATSLLTLIEAQALGLTGVEQPEELAADRALMSQLEDVRVQAALLVSAARKADSSSYLSPAKLAVAIVAAPHDPPNSESSDNQPTRAELLVRAISMGQPHKAIPATDAMTIAAAAKIPGTIVQEVASARAKNGSLVMSHPAGLCEAWADVRAGASWELVSAGIDRTARRLMSGNVYFTATARRRAKQTTSRGLANV